MGKYEDARRNLHRMEEELLAEEAEYEEEYDEEWDEEENGAFSPGPRVFETAEFDEEAAVPPAPENRKVGKLLLLAILEIAAIAAIVRWWIQWL